MTEEHKAPVAVEALLWAMHVRGPDDVYPAPDYETALLWSDYVNYRLAPRSPDIMTAATPALWIYSPEQHAAGLEQAIADWTMPVGPDGLPQTVVPIHRHRRAIMTTPVADVALDSESVKPIAWARRWYIDGEVPAKVRKDNGRMAWPTKFTYHEVTKSKCFADDVALIVAPDVPTLTDGEGEDFPMDAPELAQLAWLCRAAIEQVPSWIDDGNLVTAHAHAGVLTLDLPEALSQASAYKERVAALEAVLLKFADAYEDQGSLCGAVSEVVEAETAMDTAYVETRALLNGADR